MHLLTVYHFIHLSHLNLVTNITKINRYMYGDIYITMMGSAILWDGPDWVSRFFNIKIFQHNIVMSHNLFVFYI